MLPLPEFGLDTLYPLVGPIDQFLGRDSLAHGRIGIAGTATIDASGLNIPMTDCGASVCQQAACGDGTDDRGSMRAARA
jgi:hypothetical protein